MGSNDTLSPALKVPSNLSSPELLYSFQQHLAFVLPRCCRSSTETYDTRRSPTVPCRTPRFSRELLRTLSDLARQQLPSAKRFEFVRHEHNGFPLCSFLRSVPLSGKTSRKFPLKGLERFTALRLHLPHRSDTLFGCHPPAPPMPLTKHRRLSGTLTFKSCPLSRAEPILRMF